MTVQKFHSKKSKSRHWIFVLHVVSAIFFHLLFNTSSYMELRLSSDLSTSQHNWPFVIENISCIGLCAKGVAGSP